MNVQCEVCGNHYDKGFRIVRGAEAHSFDCFECAIYAMAPRCAHCGCSVIGHGDRPSWFTTTVVIPCDTRFGAARRAGSGSRSPPRGLEPSSACEWMSMNPGATYFPVASMTRAAGAFGSGPTAAMRPP